MTLTHNIYEDLFKSIKSGDYNNLSKLYTTPQGLSLIYAVSRDIERRILYFPIDEKTADKIPQCQGLSIGKVHLYEYSTIDYFCEISQKTNSEDYIFEIIIEDIRKNVSKLSSKEQMAVAVTSLLLKWRAFFAQEKALIMSPERQQGLYGELLTLKQLITIYGPVAVSYWTGCNYETHDFYIKSNAIEVKTTSTKAPYKMHISSEYQLDDSEVTGCLLVDFYALRKSSADGETLPQMVSSIREAISENQLMRNKFEASLETYGYFDGLENKYTTGYRVREKHTFCVKNGFPRITKTDLREGISGCTYDILTSACLVYQIPEEEKISKLKGSGNIGG